MAEVSKKKKKEKLNVEEVAVKKSKKENPKKEQKNKKKDVKKKEEKKSLWVRFRIFCHGVKTEFSKVHWPGKKDMVKNSVATIFFVIFCALFFYLVNIIFALIQTLFN